MICLIIFFVIISSVKPSEMGAYELRVENMMACTVAKKPAYKIKYYINTFQQDGKQILRWNLTMPRRNSPLKVRFTIETIQNNVRTKVYDNEDVACNHFFFKAILKLSNFSIDNSDCAINKGFYVSKEINPNGLLHVMSKVMPYGEYVLRQEWHVPRGNMVCHEFLCKVTPVKK